MQTWSKRHYYSGKEKKPQERWNYLGGIIHRMLAKPNLDFIQSSLHSSVLLVTVCYAKLRDTCLFHFFLQFFLSSFWTCAFLTENVFPTYSFWVVLPWLQLSTDHFFTVSSTWNTAFYPRPCSGRALSQLNLVWRRRLPSSQRMLKPPPSAQATCSPSDRSFAYELIMSWKPLIKLFLILKVVRGYNNKANL